MFTGLGSITLVLIFAMAVWLSLVARRILAVWIAASGLAITAYFAVSVMLGQTIPWLVWPYRFVNIYLFLLFGIILAVAGGTGLLVRLFGHLRTHRRLGGDDRTRQDYQGKG